ncbi:hypothetical protein CgunFtcFv8_026965 [Champsocephalus gunnari]|uniref:Uncharacterized protein n=1 Tax=Champsocephalus gunnari TaxID=52237 RepID=A0AAN8DXZ5_CHAGU|nr:hypothetical protein CgunFtcFv8_026965 [Champsocephalus gunnari]
MRVCRLSCLELSCHNRGPALYVGARNTTTTALLSGTVLAPVQQKLPLLLSDEQTDLLYLSASRFLMYLLISFSDPDHKLLSLACIQERQV